ncbi:E3 ubiquitin-protein ligase RNF166 [Pangasianodon hypophthalmus]|uniref:E3 ubiquitin-protein ligase RNF166 n=1 Tax=Pangasianodon hypophthalmus TaxID=310915 RepID=UPI002307AAEF|nr:E3 ubiquitin-protein ligase RNF166 [Pangasianodon hypophthalmus]
MDGDMDDDCPVCKGPLQNPSQPISCCRKVFCQSCLRHAILVRPQCPYCRSPVNDRVSLALRSAIPCTVNLQGSDAFLPTTRTVGPNVQALLSRLRAASAQASQTASAPNASLLNQVASNAAVQDTSNPALGRPVPRPRRQANIQVAPVVSVAPASNPISIQANTSPQPDLQSDDPDDMDWPSQITMMENASHSGNILRTYNCPYCQEGGLDDLDLRDHCNDNHLNDLRQVVCPVCVSLPHGNPTYCSRDFIGHLNLRHSYYIDDITNIHQNDDINLQDAILRSWQQT